jgi:hypothetical protein
MIVRFVTEDNKILPAIVVAVHDQSTGEADLQVFHRIDDGSFSKLRVTCSGKRWPNTWHYMETR